MELAGSTIVHERAPAALPPSMREMLILSPYFPPSTVAGVHRARHLAKHLPATGWTPIVMCVDEMQHEHRLDPELAELVPSSTEILKCAALPANFSRLFGLGDITLRAWISIRRAIFQLMRRRDIKLVLITGAPFYPMMFAPAISRQFHLPVVLDFQDPWVSNWGSRQPLASKAGISHRLAKILEPRALRAAAFVTSVSAVQNAEMATRYPWFESSRMAAIPIGGDPDDFEFIRSRQQPLPDGILDPTKINLSFVGTYMPRSGALVRALFEAFASLRREQPSIGNVIRLNFVGTSNQPRASAKFGVMPLAYELGVGDAVKEIPERLPYLQALAVLALSDGVLLIGSDEPHYTASKIYPALMSGRPYLSIFHSESSGHAVLAKAGGGIALAFEGGADLSSLVPRIEEALIKLTSPRVAFEPANKGAYAVFEAPAIAKRFADVFRAVTNERR